MDLAKLNSATKYPSILTYHEMGDRGRLQPNVQVPFPQGQDLYVTEKVDGTNARIVLLPESAPIIHHGPRHWLIGSREELLTAQNDLVYAPDYGIVDALRPVAEALPLHPDMIQVWYFEVFGGNLPAAKQYTGDQKIAFRLFDEASILMSTLDMEIEKIASWRDHGGQMFKDQRAMTELLGRIEVQADLVLQRVPPLADVPSLPTSIEDTYEWLKDFSQTRLDIGGGKGRSEGVVVRNSDRTAIAKLRFEDYERTLGIKRKQ
jgi:hypothetical protein